MTNSKILSAILYVLSHRYLPPVLAIIAMTLTLPSLWYGWILDDLIHRMMLTGSGEPMWLATPSKIKTPGFDTLFPALKGLFAFFDPDMNTKSMDLGIMPWWTLPEQRISFFRPLAALTHWLDYQLWPDSAPAMHAQNILWYGIVCGLAAIFYRRIMGTVWIAGLAAFFFAVDDAHFITVLWLANRYALMALFFSLLSLIVHDRWRREEWRAGRFLAPLLFTMAVLSGEMGIAAGAYIAAYALFLDRGTWRQRLGSIIPYAFLVVIWHLAYRRMGFGTYGSAHYIDPGGEPLRYLKAAMERGPILLLGQFGWPNPFRYNLMSVPARTFLWVIALVFIALLGIMLAPMIRRDRTARFWSVGMILAILPVCGVGILEGRVLLFVGLGAMGLIAQFVGGLFQRADWLPVRIAWRVPAWIIFALFIGLHTFYAPFHLVGRGSYFRQGEMERLINIGHLPEVENQDVIIVNAPSPFYFAYLRALRILNNQSIPAHVRLLAPGYYSVEVTRMDINTVKVRPANGYLVPPGEGAGKNLSPLPSVHFVYLYQAFDRAFRDSAFPMAMAQRVNLPGMNVKIIGLTDDGRPSEARIQFTLPLEAPSLTWLQWDWKERVYVPFTPPAIGETVRVPGIF